MSKLTPADKATVEAMIAIEGRKKTASKIGISTDTLARLTESAAYFSVTQTTVDKVVAYLSGEPPPSNNLAPSDRLTVIDMVAQHGRRKTAESLGIRLSLLRDILGNGHIPSPLVGKVTASLERIRIPSPPIAEPKPPIAKLSNEDRAIVKALQREHGHYKTAAILRVQSDTLDNLLSGYITTDCEHYRPCDCSEVFTPATTSRQTTIDKVTARLRDLGY